EPVQDRLYLVGCGVARGDVGPSCRRERAGRGVALVARPRLEVVGLPRARGPADLDRHAESLAELDAVPLVLRRGLPQPVVDVERADILTPSDPDREIKEARGVAPSGEHHYDWAPRCQESVRFHSRQHLLRVHSWACLAMKISVDSVNPLSRTS